MGKLDLAKPKTDDQQDVGSASERQDGKRVVKGSKAKLCIEGVLTELVVTVVWCHTRHREVLKDRGNNEKLEVYSS